jgi:hypothetical protein
MNVDPPRLDECMSGISINIFKSGEISKIKKIRIRTADGAGFRLL